MNPRDPKGHYHRGALFMAVGQVERAILDFTTAIQINPNYTEAYANRGLMYTLVEKDAEALQDFNQAAQLGADRANLVKQADLLKIGRGPTGAN
jgi:lipoprotein NlpI